MQKNKLTRFRGETGSRKGRGETYPAWPPLKCTARIRVSSLTALTVSTSGTAGYAYPIQDVNSSFTSYPASPGRIRSKTRRRTEHRPILPYLFDIFLEKNRILHRIGARILPG